MNATAIQTATTMGVVKRRSAIVRNHTLGDSANLKLLVMFLSVSCPLDFALSLFVKSYALIILVIHYCFISNSGKCGQGKSDTTDDYQKI